LPFAISTPQRCHRCEPWFLAVTSPGNLLIAGSYSEGRRKTWPLPRRLCPAAPEPPPATTKTFFWHGLSDSLAMSPRLTSSGPHRFPESRLPVSYRAFAPGIGRLPAPHHFRAGSQRLRVFRSVTNGGASLQNSKTLVLPVAIHSATRCRRCEPWVLAATSFPWITLLSAFAPYPSRLA